MSDHELDNPLHVGRAIALLGAMFAAAAVGYALGERAFASIGLAVVPVALLVLSAYAGEHQRRSRWVSVVLLVMLALVVATGFSAQAHEFLRVRAGDNPVSAGPLAEMWAISALGLALALVALTPWLRRLAARALPIDAGRFVHAIALSLCVTLCASAFAPLMVLGEPILTALAASGDTNASSMALSEQMYQLVWSIPLCLLAVGYGVRRTLRQALERLGLTRPRLTDVAVALGLAVALVVFAAVLGTVVEKVWLALGWATTNQHGVETLMSDVMSPTGALVIGISAGLGEELLVRGTLQPRLGIALSNLVFTALHAGQYNWDLLVVIFGVGAAFGLVRKYRGTTVSALVHGLYDALLIGIAVAANG